MMRRDLLIAIALPLAVVACEPQAQQETMPQAQEEMALGAEETAAREAPATGVVDPGPEEHLVYRPGEIEWQDAPESLRPGAQVAVLEGEPGERGVFTMRIRMPDGYVISPHWHPNVERVTVLSGTFLLGTGEAVDPAAAERLEAGGYTSIPPRTNHFAIAEGETVIQLTSVGPWEINYVNAADDPRRGS